MDDVGTWCRYGAEAGGVLDLQHWHLFVKRRNESGTSERTVRRTSLGCAISQLVVSLGVTLHSQASVVLFTQMGGGN
jgi:hypothetical protein